MFEKSYEIKVGRSSCFIPTIASSRIILLKDNELLLIDNDESNFYFNFYKSGFEVNTVMLANTYGVLVSVMPVEQDLWLEFLDTSVPYEEMYSIVRLTRKGADDVATFRRESYLHDMPYHSIFVKDGAVYLYLIRHNRLHHYLLGDTAEEIDMLEGGTWYLCDSYPICAMRGLVEVYDQSLNALSTFEYDNEIDEIHCSSSDNPSMLAITLSDHTQEQTMLMIYQYDAEFLSLSILEHTSVSAIGASAGRVWVNPYGFQDQQDLGGCMIYDRNAWPLYVHIRTKSPNNGNIGPYAPPFHRCDKIVAMASGMTLIAEFGKLLIMDYNCRPVQELFIGYTSFFAVSDDGRSVVVLHADTANTSQDDYIIQENAKLVVYNWNTENDDDKVIDMSKYQR